MALVNIVLTEGQSKTGKPYYMARTVAGKYSGEPVFISVLEYEYLTEMTKPTDSSLGNE